MAIKSALVLDGNVTAVLTAAPESRNPEGHMTTKPLLGWNSFDSFGGYLHEKAAFAQLEAFAEKLAPHGYEYFVVDIGWYGEYELKPGTLFPSPDTKHAMDAHLDEHGLPLPSTCYFPNGFDGLIKRTHELGLKFGVHLMRGVPRKAVALKLPVKGAKGVTCADIANTQSTCPWCHYNYGIDMSQPGAQAYHDALVQQLADWSVDFIKADDITAYPDEILAYVHAIKKTGRDIKLSLSHGGEADPKLMPIYRHADMVRMTKDIWDDPESIERSYNAWAYWQPFTEPGFWPDLDMIPFGDLQTMSPEPEPGELPEGQNPSLCGKGFHRRDQLNADERRTFMTQRILSASPLMFGGDMTTLNEEELHLLTNPGALACNQNGVSAAIHYMRGDVQVWRAESRTELGCGWLGVFNRNPARQSEDLILTADRLGMSPGTTLHDVWTDQSIGTLADHPHLKLPPLGCVLIRYENARLEAGVTSPEPHQQPHVVSA
ncbi:MAG: glycoside hydrolase family 27 protein [Synoicihabitans sp.]